MIITTLISLIAGCAVNKGKSLLIVTGTNIGLKIGANELDKTPEFKLGYNRIEGAAVPVAVNPTTGKMETASSIAKFRYKTDIKDGSGIESMIATGESAIWKPK